MSEIKLVYPIKIAIMDVVEKDMKELYEIVESELEMAKISLIDSIECYKKGMKGG